jgi:putative endonuclease
LAYVVYVLRNREGRLYIGQTSDLERRLVEHRAGEGGWTGRANRGPWELVEAEEYGTRAEAMAREKALKSGRLNQELRTKYGSRAGGC